MSDRTKPLIILNIAELLSPLNAARKASSSTKGAASRPIKGQPSTVPIPSHMSPSAVRGPSRQSTKAANARVIAYMPTVLGRYETRSVERASTGQGYNHIHHGDPLTESLRDGMIESRLTQGTHKREKQAQRVELRRFTRQRWEPGGQVEGQCMERDIQPGSNGINGGELPCLQAVAMIEIVCWLPEVEDLITVLNRRSQSGKRARGGE